MKNEYTIKSALDFLESWIKISEIPYKHEEPIRSEQALIRHTT